jgi:hypothetical protein
LALNLAYAGLIQLLVSSVMDTVTHAFKTKAATLSAL